MHNHHSIFSLFSVKIWTIFNFHEVVYTFPAFFQECNTEPNMTGSEGTRMRQEGWGIVEDSMLAGLCLV